MTDSQPNILLIVMDTARAQTVLNNEAVMPNFHEFASEGTLFTNAFSTAPWTLPSHASMFTGQYTSDHGTHAGSKEFDPEVPTLAEELQSSGYQTVGFSNNVWISPEFGFDRGFDTLRTSMQLVEGGADLGSIAKENSGISEQGLAVLKTLLQRNGHRTLINGFYSKFLRGRYDDGARLTNWRIKRWLSERENQKKPFFMFVNYLEPHLEYDPPEEFKYRFISDRLTSSDLDTVNQDAWSYLCGQIAMDDLDFKALSALYKAELNYLDYRLGKLFSMFEQRGILDETVVVIVGDHGENLGDHDLMDHQYCLYDTLLRVPLLIRYPDAFPENKRYSQFVELRDVFPTILDLAKVSTELGETISNKKLVSITHENKAGREQVYAEYLKPQPSMEALKNRTGSLPSDYQEYNRALRSLRTENWKLVEDEDRKFELYNISKDPEELNDISEDNLRQVAELEKKIYETAGEFPREWKQQERQITDGIKSRLKELGYIQE